MKNNESNPDSEASGCRAMIEINISNPTVKLQDKLQGLQEITALQPPPFRRLLASTNAASSPTRPGRSSKASTPTMMTRSPSNNVLTTLELKVRTLHHHLCSSPLLLISSKQQRQAATATANSPTSRFSAFASSPASTKLAAYNSSSVPCSRRSTYWALRTNSNAAASSLLNSSRYGAHRERSPGSSRTSEPPSTRLTPHFPKPRQPQVRQQRRRF
ncbi:hypothetical protein ACFX2I_046315 [Malus domestica]